MNGYKIELMNLWREQMDPRDGMRVAAPSNVRNQMKMIGLGRIIII